MNDPLIDEFDFHLDRSRRGKELRPGPAPTPAPRRVPRIARLMALAHRLDALLRTGTFRRQAQIAAVGHVTAARLSQIMTLLNLAPDIQEAVLFLPRVERGRDPVILADLLPIARESDWQRQRRLWRAQGRKSSAAASRRDS